MSEPTAENLSDISETLLIPLYYRAIETQRPDAMIKDEKAVELIKQLSPEVPIRYDSDWFKQTPGSEVNKVLRIMLTRQMDRYAQDFICRRPQAVVVHIGCGLDSRFERVDNGQIEWYDLDVPKVIELRRKLIGEEGGRYHLLGCSVFEDAWLDVVRAQHGRPFLFLAEGVFMCFFEAHVKSLVIRLRNRFPGAELVFDAWSLSKSGSATSYLEVFCAGASGAARKSKSGEMASVCLTNGVTSTSLSLGCAPFAGWRLSSACSNPCAFSTSSLGRQQGDVFGN